MKYVSQFIRTTVLGGIFFLIPIVILYMLLEKALDLSHKIIEPIAGILPFDDIGGVGIRVILAVGLLLLFCFVVGLISMTHRAKAFSKKIEESVLSSVPGYQFFKHLGESMVQIEGGQEEHAILISFDDNKAFGFLIEELENNQSVVFLPDAPNPWGGAVLVVENDRIQSLKHSTKEMIKVLKQLGYGSKVMLEK